MKNYPEELYRRAANNIRILSLSMVEKAKSGHPGGAMGGADFINVLFSSFLHFNPDDGAFPFRDRFFLDPGHMSPMLYSVLHLAGFYSTEDLKQFRQWGSVTPGHPELDLKRGVENTSGPLGQGHAMAVGAAIAERFIVARYGELFAHKTYAYISDGGVQEEIAQGAGRMAGHLGLNNLIMFYDANEVQLSTKVSEVMSEDTASKYEAWGWRVYTVDGNDPVAVLQILTKAHGEKEKPVLIIGRTVMAKGAVAADGSSFEGKVSTHGQPLSKAGASVGETIKNLHGDPENPFAIFNETAELYRDVIERNRLWAENKMSEYEQWKKENPALASEIGNVFSGETNIPGLEHVEVKPGAATRDASSAALASFAGNVPNMLVMSADLANSDKTDGFLKKSKPITRNDFSGAFLHAGVSELTMAALANGMALHYLRPVCGTFFAFSDYMKPAVRLAALMELPVIYIWTHDSFRVGEDGPTHQPVEHEAQIRLMEYLRNHSGNPSMLVLRPADTAETLVSWEMALQQKTPAALILSRQGIKDLPASKGKESRYESAQLARKGAYLISGEPAGADVVLVACGSEVRTCLDAARLLSNNGIDTAVVSMISEALFRRQEPEYQRSVLPEDAKVFALTAGLAQAFTSINGKNKTVFGMDHFGYSAPYTVLDEKFGFTPDQVARKVTEFLK
ncbi:MAG: transketolase [Bacteroidales bacterium]